MKKIITILIIGIVSNSPSYAQIDSNRHSNDSNTLSNNKPVNKPQNKDSLNLQKKMPPKHNRDGSLNFEQIQMTPTRKRFLS